MMHVTCDHLHRPWYQNILFHSKIRTVISITLMILSFCTCMYTMFYYHQLFSSLIIWLFLFLFKKNCESACYQKKKILYVPSTDRRSLVVQKCNTVACATWSFIIAYRCNRLNWKLEYFVNLSKLTVRSTASCNIWHSKYKFVGYTGLLQVGWIMTKSIHV